MDSLQSFTVKLNGSDLTPSKTDRLRELRVHRPLNAPAEATLRFADYELGFADEYRGARGQTLEISIAEAGSQNVVFKGTIDAVGLEIYGNQPPTFQLTAHDKSTKISSKVLYKTYLNMKAYDVLQQLASESGLTLECPSDGDVRAWSTSSGLLQMLDDFTTHLGLCWMVDGDTLKVFKPAVAVGEAIELDAQEELLRFESYASSAGVGSTVEVISWDPKNAAEISASGNLGADTFAQTNLGTSTEPVAQITMVADRATSSADATARATAVQSMLEQDALTCRGVTRRARTGLAPGGSVKVGNLGDTFSGVYLITEVEHLLAPKVAETRFRCGSIPRPLLSPEAGRADSPGLQPMIGLVTAHADGSANDDPGFKAAVKVKLPAMGTDYESTWAPVISPFAGADRGMVMIPDINDQVVVVFEGGQLDRPMVIGSMWTSSHKLDPQQAVSNGAQQDYRLVTSWGAHLALTQVSTSEDKIELTTKGSKSTVSMTPTLIKVSSSDNKTIELSSGQGSIVIKDGKDITIKGVNVTIEATQNLNLKGTAKLAAEGTGGLEAKGATVKIEGQATAEISAAGVTTVKGAMVKVN